MSNLLPCRRCGSRCSEETFANKYITGEAKVFICSNHKLLGGNCDDDSAYMTEEAWNDSNRSISYEEECAETAPTRLAYLLYDTGVINDYTLSKFLYPSSEDIVRARS